MEWKQNYFSRPSVVAASSFHIYLHILGVIQLNCLPDVSSYTALFANWQIVDIYINLIYINVNVYSNTLLLCTISQSWQ